MTLSFISPLFTNNPAFAVNTSPSLTDSNYLNWNIQSNWYRQAISQCLAGITPYPVKSQNDVQSGNWFTAPGLLDLDRSMSPTGYYMRDTLGGIGDDGQTDCWENNSELLTKALQLWGLDGMTLACDANLYQRVNGTTCQSSRGGNGEFKPVGSQTEMANKFRDYITKTIYGGVDPQLTDAMQFVLYKRTLIMGCAYNSQTPQTSNPGGNNVYAVTSVYKGTPDNLTPGASVQQQTKVQTTTEYYVGDQSPDTQRWLWTNPNAQKSCQDLANAIAPGSQYANAYIAYLQANNVDPATTGGIQTKDTPDAAASSCVIPGIGWIVCPVTTFLAGVADQVYNVLKALLTVPPLNTSTTSDSNGTYIAWSYMRNIANIVFVIAFVIIIYSQITGMGVNNYGIKKLLPRIIVAAILVNASYWICAIAVDISNILGMSIRGLLDSAASKMPVPPSDPLSTGGVWQGITVAILAATGVAILGLTILLPILIAALAAAVTVLIVLVLRQALIVMLIFIAPLAFVAMLLPNTEKWFAKWRETFVTLLLVFPIIAFVFGGSNLASRVLAASSITMEGDTNGWFMKIVAAGITVIPLFIVPILMKASGGLLSRFAGVVNNPNKGVFDRMRKGSESLRKDRENIRNMRALKGANQLGRGNFVRWRARQRAISSGREAEMNRANTEYLADQSRTNENFRNAAAGGTNYMGSPLKTADPEASRRALANAINVKAKLEADEVTAAQAIIKDANLDLKQMQQLALGKNVTDSTGKTIMAAAPNSALQTAAIQNQFKVGDVEKTDELVAKSGGMDLLQRQAIAEGAQSLSGKVKYYGGGTSDAIKQGMIKSESDLDKEVAASIKGKKYGQQDLAAQDKDALARISRVAADANTENADILRQIAKDLQNNDKIYPTVDERRQDRIGSIANGKVYNDSGQIPGQGTLF